METPSQLLHTFSEAVKKFKEQESFSQGRKVGKANQAVVLCDSSHLCEKLLIFSHVLSRQFFSNQPSAQPFSRNRIFVESRELKTEN